MQPRLGHALDVDKQHYVYTEKLFIGQRNETKNGD